MTTLTKREATAVADALVLWRRRARTPQLLSDAELDRLIERCLEGPHRKRWEYRRVMIEANETAGDVLAPFGREGWEVISFQCGRERDVLYLRRELQEEI